MINCPMCTDELDDGYCHTCEHDLYDEPEWFLQKVGQRVEELEALIAMIREYVISGTDDIELENRILDALAATEQEGAIIHTKANAVLDNGCLYISSTSAELTDDA